MATSASSSKTSYKTLKGMDVFYAPSFVRAFAALPVTLQEETLEKMKLFRDPKYHQQLKVHKLHGRLKERWSFTVNYKTRIIFRFQKTIPKTALFLAIGDHDIYD